MKLQWMKDILGEAYTEEADAKVCAALGERFVARGDFNDRGAKLQEQIDSLKARNREQKDAFQQELARTRLASAVEAELTAAGSRNNTALRAVLGTFLEGAQVVDGRVVAQVNGERVTLAGKLEEMKQDAGTGFLFASSLREGWRPGESGDGLPAARRPDQMSYSELSAYLEQNPGVRLE